MDFTTNIFLLIGAFVLFLYVIFVFILFLPSIGFGLVPIIILALFGGFAILVGVFYNNYNPDDEYTKSDTIYLVGMTVAAIVGFVAIVFVMWLIYTQFTKPIPESGGMLDSKEHLEDIKPKDIEATPFNEKGGIM